MMISGKYFENSLLQIFSHYLLMWVQENISYEKLCKYFIMINEQYAKGNNKN